MTEKVDIVTKIEHVIDEVRVILPGTQALVGFQFAAVFTDGFSKLPQQLQYMHLLSLLCAIIAILLLMAPTAYHRIVDDGEDSDRLHDYATNLLIIAMVILAVALATDVYVVFAKVLHSTNVAVIAAMGVFSIASVLWFGYTLFMRKH